jgi:hypothetical protein
MFESAVPATSWRVQRVMWAAGAGIGALVAATVMLWAHYGSALFFEMIVAGLASCF